jgi:hypothetical protein
MPKKPAVRGDPPPASSRPWVLRPVSARAQKEWEEAADAEPELMAAMRERLRLRPLDRSDNPSRTHRLKPPLAEKLVGRRKLPQWQHEITGGGRVFYCPDQADRVVWVTKVELGHPRETG